MKRNIAAQCEIILQIVKFDAVASSEKTAFVRQTKAVFLERVMGVEPTYSAWEADILPMNYICMYGRGARA